MLRRIRKGLKPVSNRVIDAAYLKSKGWTTYFNAYLTEKWVSPDQTAVMPLRDAIQVQELAEYYNIEFAIIP